MPTTNVYLNALAVLRREGWRQHGRPRSPGVCLLTAMAQAQGIDAWTHVPLVQRIVLSDIIREQYPKRATGSSYSLPWRWNDGIATSQEEVEQILEKAAIL
jgi:hypothetical protein